MSVKTILALTKSGTPPVTHKGNNTTVSQIGKYPCFAQKQKAPFSTSNQVAELRALILSRALQATLSLQAGEGRLAVSITCEKGFIHIHKWQ
jgi:hypothetical protein